MSEPREQLPEGDSELWSLVEAVVEGTAGPQEQERLEARLRAETPAQVFYVAYLDLHAHLQWRTRGESGEPGAQVGRIGNPSLIGSPCGTDWQSVLPQAAPLPSRARRLRRLRRGLTFAAALAVAAGLLFAVFWFRPGEEGEPPDLPNMPAGSVAVLIDSSNTVWEKDTTLPTATGSALPPGRMKLKAGIAEIAFHGGGEVLLEGPAELDVAAADRAFLHRGKLVAQVPEGAGDFQIRLPGLVVTDHGGECGVWSDDSGRSEVHVFEGKVGADPTDRQGQPLPGLRLAEKAGARVDPSRGALTPVPLNEQAFARLRPEVRVADATVRGGQFADRNFGTAPRLVVKNSTPDYTWDSYLRFDLSGVKGTVSEATVRLVPVRVGQPIKLAAAFVPDNRWGETTITWATKPASGPVVARWTTEEGKPVEFDVTRLVREALAGDKKLSLRLFAPERKRGSGFAQFGSRRGDAASRPQLLLTMEP